MILASCHAPRSSRHSPNCRCKRSTASEGRWLGRASFEVMRDVPHHPRKANRGFVSRKTSSGRVPKVRAPSDGTGRSLLRPLSQDRSGAPHRGRRPRASRDLSPHHRHPLQRQDSAATLAEIIWAWSTHDVKIGEDEDTAANFFATMARHASD